ncbi:hypothetical protein [Mesorhizobium sp. 128a]
MRETLKHLPRVRDAPANPQAFPGSRPKVLIADDDLSFAFSLSNALVAAAADVYHPAGTLEDALDVAMYCEIDAAILSVCIHGEECFVVAENLLRRKIPLAFALSENSFDIPEVFAQIPRMFKSDMIDQLPRLLGYIGIGYLSRDTGV